jgi:hypothetical protein
MGGRGARHRPHGVGGCACVWEGGGWAGSVKLERTLRQPCAPQVNTLKPHTRHPATRHKRHAHMHKARVHAHARGAHHTHLHPGSANSTGPTPRTHSAPARQGPCRKRTRRRRPVQTADETANTPHHYTPAPCACHACGWALARELSAVAGTAVAGRPPFCLCPPWSALVRLSLQQWWVLPRPRAVCTAPAPACPVRFIPASMLRGWCLCVGSCLRAGGWRSQRTSSRPRRSPTA